LHGDPALRLGDRDVAAITMSSRAIMTTIMMALYLLTPSPVTKYFHAWISAPGQGGDDIDRDDDRGAVADALSR
jgi:hypothetical protein